MKIGNRVFDTENSTYIMGILNVTPDSFSDGGRWNDKDSALRHVELMIKEGADIIDVGGESTRPGYKKITAVQEIERIVPVIEALKSEFDIPLSVDTYKSEVASAAIEAGADLINDIWGLRADDKMAEVIAKSNIPCCLMHNRNLDKEPYGNFLEDVISDLKKSIKIATNAGISQHNIITDPGIGFAKTYSQNLEIMKNIELLKELKCPILLGTSRKSMIGLTLELPVEERLEGTIATTVFGVMKGCAFFRVHDVKENLRAIKMTKAILG